MLPTGEIIHRIPEQPQPTYYGHETKPFSIHPKLCLIGCVFFMSAYDTTDNGNGLFVFSDKQKKLLLERIKRFGGEIEESYGPNCTHVVVDSQHRPVVAQALKDGKRVVTVYWIDAILSNHPQKVRPPWIPWHLPVASCFHENPLKEHVSE